MHLPTGRCYIPGDISYFVTFKVFFLTMTEIEILLDLKLRCLTGAHDVKGVMCLFDPHTCVFLQSKSLPPSLTYVSVIFQ